MDPSLVEYKQFAVRPEGELESYELSKLGKAKKPHFEKKLQGLQFKFSRTGIIKEKSIS